MRCNLRIDRAKTRTETGCVCVCVCVWEVVVTYGHKKDKKKRYGTRCVLASEGGGVACAATTFAQGGATCRVKYTSVDHLRKTADKKAGKCFHQWEDVLRNFPGTHAPTTTKRTHTCSPYTLSSKLVVKLATYPKGRGHGQWTIAAMHFLIARCFANQNLALEAFDDASYAQLSALRFSSPPRTAPCWGLETFRLVRPRDA